MKQRSYWVLQVVVLYVSTCAAYVKKFKTVWRSHITTNNTICPNWWQPCVCVSECVCDAYVNSCTLKGCVRACTCVCVCVCTHGCLAFDDKNDSDGLVTYVSFATRHFMVAVSCGLFMYCVLQKSEELWKCLLYTSAIQKWLLFLLVAMYSFYFYKFAVNFAYIVEEFDLMIKNKYFVIVS